MRKRSASRPVLGLSLALCLSLSALAASPSPARLQQLANDPYWLAIGHYETGKLGGWRSYVDDDDFFLSPDGPHDPGAVAGLEHVGCEACHGPGKAHVGNPPTVEMRASPDVSVCVGCHDGKQDEGRFDPVTYFPRVAHGAK